MSSWSVLRVVRGICCLVPLALLAAGLAFSQSNLSDATLEQLLNTPVTSVARKTEKLSQTAAAVFVISQDDIRRSGAISIPDVLRLAPGVNVAHVSGGIWAISIRGFNNVYSNKALVLVDGRSVYTTAFSGVSWDQLDIPLEEIERIEVIRGPGGSVWGANAVNGVINIITKSTRDTHGGMLSAGGGNRDHAGETMQYGGSMGGKGDYRVFAHYSDTAPSMLPDGSPGGDGEHHERTGFRTDWSLTPQDSLTVEGDVFATNGTVARQSAFIQTPLSQVFSQDLDSRGESMLVHWTHNLANGSDESVRAYFNGFHRTELGTSMSESSLDVEYQNHRALGSRQDVVWGGEYRLTDTYLRSSPGMSFNPERRGDGLYSAFLQDEVRVSPRFWITLGSKFEHNPYTGFGIEPSLRLTWAPTAKTTFWSSAGQAIRQPAREETSVQMDLGTQPLAPGLNIEAWLYGNPRMQTEQVRDYEFGYRTVLGRSLSLDVATFLSFYDRLATISPQGLTVSVSDGALELQVPMQFGNASHATDFGGEIFMNWDVTARWRLSPSYALLRSLLEMDSSAPNATPVAPVDLSPEHTFLVRSRINLPWRTSFDQSVGFTSRLSGNSIPGHWRLDLSVARRLGESGEISVVGQNLLSPRFLEFGDAMGFAGTEIQRSIYGKVTWRF